MAGEVVAGRTGLGALVLVVREREVLPTTVEIEPFAQQIERHRRALDVPARTAPTPRRVPGGLARLGRLPEREVHRAALGLVDVDPGTGRFAQLLERPVWERAVTLERLDREVHALARNLIGVPGLDEFADEVEHAVDVLGGVGAMIGFAHTEAGHVVEVHRSNSCATSGSVRPSSAARAMILSSTSVTLLTYVTSNPAHSR